MVLSFDWLSCEIGAKMTITKSCVACMMCIEWCSSDAIKRTKINGHFDVVHIDQDLCTKCGACSQCDCPMDALEEN